MLPYTMLEASGRAVTLASMGELLAEGEVLATSQTYAFTVLGVSQLFHALGMRDTGRSVLGMKPGENILMLLAMAIGLSLQVTVTRIPFLVSAFGTVRLSGREWFMLIILAAFPLLAHECIVIAGRLWKDRRA